MSRTVLKNEIKRCAVGVIKNTQSSQRSEHGQAPQHQILIAKRPLHKPGGGFWEFPGGKIEVQETPEQALIRELQEEIDITPTSYEPLIQYPYDYPNFQVFLEVFLIHQCIGVPSSKEGQTLRWVNIQDLNNYSFLEANKIIIDKLNGVRAQHATKS